MHHIVSDGWSMDLLYRELALHYDACRSGRIAAVVELPVQYRDFAAWQRSWLKDEVLNRLVDVLAVTTARGGAAAAARRSILEFRHG